MQQTIPVNDAIISSHVGSEPSTGPFQVDFPFFSLNDVVVTRADDGYSYIRTLVRGVDYDLVGVSTEDGSFSSGTVTLILAVSNTTITRSRTTPIERLSNFPLQGFFSRLALNAELNRIVMWMQEQYTQYIGSLRNALQIPSSEVGKGVIASPTIDRKGKVLAWDSLGNLIHSTKSLAEIEASIPGSGSIEVPVDEFGAVGDGVADDTLAIQAAIDAAGAAPCGNVLIPAKTYKITQTLDVPYPNVSIIGAGADVAHTAGSQGQQPVTKLVWGGALGGIMLHIRSPIGVTAQGLTGGGVQGVYFHCTGSSVGSANTGADIGIRISSRRSGWYEDLFFEQPRRYGLLLDTVDQLGDDRGCHNNVFFTCNSRNTYSNIDGGLVKLEGDLTTPPGEVSANCYFNRFFNCRPVFNSGICYDIANSDHNDFIGCSANCVNHSYATIASKDATITLANPAVVTTATPHGFITGHCVQFVSNGDTLPAPLAFNTKYYVTTVTGSSTMQLSTTLANRVAGILIDTSAGSQSGTHKLLAYAGYGIYFHASDLEANTARCNHFTSFSGGDVIYCEGTENGLIWPSHHNIFSLLDYGNYTPQPIRGTGATASVLSRDDGTVPRGKQIATAIGSPTLLSVTNSLLMDKIQARIATESLRISNGAVDHIRFELPAGDYNSVTAEWNVGITGGGDLRWNRLIGTGNMTLIGGFRSISTAGGIGYGVGAGGSVSQTTSKLNTVSLNRACGLIITSSDLLAADTSFGFQLTNSALAVGDVLVLNHDPTVGGTEGQYVLNARCFAGAAQITVRNVSASGLAENIGIRFAVIKGVVT